MDTLMQIGGNVDKASVEALGDLILNILRVGAETRMDQKTVRLALGIIGEFASVKNVSISGCYLSETGADSGIKMPQSTVDTSGAA